MGQDRRTNDHPCRHRSRAFRGTSDAGPAAATRAVALKRVGPRAALAALDLFLDKRPDEGLATLSLADTAARNPQASEATGTRRGAGLEAPPPPHPVQQQNVKPAVSGGRER